MESCSNAVTGLNCLGQMSCSVNFRLIRFGDMLHLAGDYVLICKP